jgi:uncharacterized MAPEG superfamily protein
VADKFLGRQRLSAVPAGGAVIIAHQLRAGQTLLDILAFLFVMLRIFYIMMYVSDMPKARSMVWGAGFMVNIAIFFIGYR